MSLTLKTYVDLPSHLGPGGFDHAAVHGGRARVYVAHTVNSAVDVIDTDADRYLYSVPDLSGCAGALVCEEQDLVFTSNRGENTVSVFKSEDRTFGSQIPVGIRPNGMAYDAERRRLLVAHVGNPHSPSSASVAILDAATRSVIGTLPIPLDGVEGRIDHMTVDEKSGRLYLAALGSNSVEVIDLAAGKKVETLKGMEEPQGLAFIPETQRLVVASGQDGKCRIYDATLKVIATIDGLEDADNVRYEAKTKEVYVGYGSGALAIIDPQGGIKVGEIKLAGHPESFQLEKNGNRIFVNVPGAGHVAVVDRDKKEVIAKWSIPDAKSNFPMALDEANHRLFIGCRNPAKLVVLDTETGKMVNSLDVVGDTDDVFYSVAGKQIYVSGGAGQVSIVAQKDADTYSVVGQLNTANGARTSLFVPASGILYVAVPHRGTQAAELRLSKMAEPVKP